MKTAEFSITSGSDVQIDQDSCTPADWFLNRIVRQQQSDQNLPFGPHHTVHLQAAPDLAENYRGRNRQLLEIFRSYSKN